MRQFWVRFAIALVLTLGFAAIAPLLPVLKPSVLVAQSAPPRTVFVYLFEWGWEDVASECEAFLGPKGFAAVHVTPPHEHRLVAGRPWYERYQLVSYQLESRSGTRSQFANMVSRCKRAGVDVYVDAVLNHTTGVLEPGQTETGFAGSRFGRYDYPGTYSPADFHACDRNGNNDIQNFQDRYEVQNCELVNLADLKTEAPYVRGRLAAYLNDLISLGVAGFRIDAAKHIPADDLRDIFSRLKGKPYIYQEVTESPGEPIRASEYVQTGDVTEFNYHRALNRIFTSGKLADLLAIGDRDTTIASTDAIVFVDNHDTQRSEANRLNFKQRSLYELATVFLLAYPYGYPELQSSFAFEQFDQRPPLTPQGAIQPVFATNASTCRTEWICEHRWRAIANMVAFRNQTASNFRLTDWWTNGNNQIAFGRGDAGFVVINREDQPLSQSLQTSLPAGIYCDVISGDWLADQQRCTGTQVKVDRTGIAAISAPAMSAVAIHRGAKIQ